MTKNPRDERVWTNIEVQEDAQGYLAAQLRRRQDEERELQRRREADDRDRFTEAFVAEGGDPDDAKAVWKEIRNDRAAEAARLVEEASLADTRRHMSRTL
jgi:hypothetical protein